MKLILFRHADAKNAEGGQSDHGRRLSKRGRADAAAGGRFLASLPGGIDLALASDSRRTRETWELAAAELSAPPKAVYLNDIYRALSYFPILREHGGDAETVIVVGHNPAVHETALAAASDLDGEAGLRLSQGFQKGALVVLTGDGSWTDLQPGQMRLEAYAPPGSR